MWYSHRYSLAFVIAPRHHSQVKLDGQQDESYNLPIYFSSSHSYQKYTIQIVFIRIKSYRLAQEAVFWDLTLSLMMFAVCVWLHPRQKRSVSPSLQWPAGFLTQLSLSQAMTTAPVFWPAKSAVCYSSQITHWRIPIQLQHNLASGASPCCVHQGKWRNTATVNAAWIDCCLNVWVVCYTWLQVTTWRLTSAPTATLSVISDWASAA